MAKFEVHIPAADPGGFSMTLKVSAANWMAALKAGMQKLGEQGAVSQNVMVDIQEDNSIHITESASGRVFRIRELTEEEAATAPVKRPSGIQRLPPSQAKTEPPPSSQAKTEPPSSSQAKTEPPPRQEPEGAKTLIGVPGFEPKATDVTKTQPGTAPAVTQPGGPRTPARAQPAASARPPMRSSKSRPPTKSSPRVEVGEVEELEAPVRPVTGQIGRPRTNPSVQASIRQQTDDILADVFMRITELEAKPTVEDAMQFILDLAMEKVPCEAGSVLRSDGATGDLQFLVARGPAAKDLIAKNIVLPAGEGIAGFCAAEGVSVAVGDVQKDPRHFSGVGEKVAYETKSMLCAPMMTHGRSFGCVQLLNRKGSAQFLEHEMGVLAYLSHQGALYLNSRL